MRQYQYIIFETIDDIAHVTLNCPEKNNVLHSQMLAELSELCDTLSKLSNIRVVILKAAGAYFCAGADFKSMHEHIHRPFNENKDDAIGFGLFLHKLSTLPQPLIGLVQGNAYADGLGIIACCDIVIASEQVEFCFSEVKLGLVPAMITPHIIRKIGFSHTKMLYLTADVFDSHYAKQIELLHYVVPESDLTQTAIAVAEQLKKNAPLAMAQCKQLVDQFYPIEPQMIDFTAEIAAHLHVSEEAQERMQQFLKNE